jgi:hypothetical protein
VCAGVLVACLGHYNARARGLAVRLLNALYDRVDWQLSEALTPVVSFVDCPFSIDAFVLKHEHTSFKGDALRVLVSAPSMGNVGGSADNILTCHLPVVNEEEIWVTVQSEDSGGRGVGLIVDVDVHSCIILSRHVQRKPSLVTSSVVLFALRWIL